MRKPKPRTTRRNTTEDLTEQLRKRPGGTQRVRVIVEIDISEDHYSRDDLNNAAIASASQFHKHMELDERLCEVVFLTTEEITT